jgi:PmbA protein
MNNSEIFSFNPDYFFSRLEKLIEFALKQGATEAQIYFLNSDDFSVEIRNSNIQELNKSISTNLAIKILVDDKVATASSSDIRNESIEILIKNAIKRAQYSEADPYSRLADFITNDFNVEELEIYDPQIELIDADFKIQQAKELEKIALTDKRIKVSDGSMYGTSISEVFVVNSKGLKGSFRSSSVGAGIHLHAGDEENMFEDGYWYNSIKLSQMMESDLIAQKAIERVTRLIGAKKIPSGNFPVVFEPSVASSIFGFFAACISGSNIYLNRSYLTNKLNEKIASSKLTIIDNGRIKGGIGSIPFDSDGTPTSKNLIVENGVLKNYLLGVYSARKLGLKSTGNASGPTNFIIQPSDYTQEDLVKSIDKGILITNLIGQGTDTTTGDISKGAFGIMIENGELTYPVAEITISGNLGDILNNIEMVANNAENVRLIQAPATKIKEISVSGT